MLQFIQEIKGNDGPFFDAHRATRRPIIDRGDYPDGFGCETDERGERILGELGTAAVFAGLFSGSDTGSQLVHEANEARNSWIRHQDRGAPLGSRVVYHLIANAHKDVPAAQQHSR